MSYVEFFTCRVAIQVCTGYLPNGRKRRRTFSMRGIRPDASVESIAAVVRALAPLLIYPIIKVRKIVKRTIIFDPAEFTAPAAPVAVVPVAAAVIAVAPVVAVADNGPPWGAAPTMLRNFFVGVAALGDPCRVGNLPVLAAGRLPRPPPVLGYERTHKTGAFF